MTDPAQPSPEDRKGDVDPVVEFWFTATLSAAECPGWMLGARLRGQIAVSELVRVFGPLKSETPEGAVVLRKPAIDAAASRRARSYPERPADPIRVTADDFTV